MGLFGNKTEEERKLEEERKILISLRDRIINSSELDQFTTKVLVDYINGVLNGTRKNDFYDIEFLYRVFDKLTVNEYMDGSDVKQHLEKIISCVNDFLPFGTRTVDYELKREYIIDNFVGPNGFIDKGIYDFSVYDKFDDDMNSYSLVMKSISKNDYAIKHFDSLKKYISDSRRWFSSTSAYAGALLSIIDGFDKSVLDVDTYFATQLVHCKEAVGVYSVDHTDIVRLNELFKRSASKISEVGHSIKLLEDKKKEVLAVVSEGEQRIMDLTDASTRKADEGVQRIIEEIDEGIKRFKKEVNATLSDFDKRVDYTFKTYLEKLDSHVEILKSDISSHAETVFSEKLIEYSELLKGIKASSENYAQANKKELADFKKQSDDILSILRSYENDPKYKETLAHVEQSVELRDRILELIQQNQEFMSLSEYKKYKEATPNGAQVEGIERLVVPDKPNIIIPKSIVVNGNQELLPYYSFNRESEKELEAIKKEIEAEKDRREKNGEIFHEKTMEVISCLLVGDWPYIYGPSGSGKGHTINQIGSLLKQRVLYGGKLGEVYDILGYIDAQGRFRAPQAFVACCNGDIIFYDEFDNSSTDNCVEAINSMYSNLRDKIDDVNSDQYILFAKEINVPINPNMRLISAGNTDGSGSDPDWFDRYPFSESIRERLKVIHFAYDPRVEKVILKKYPEWYDFFKNFRRVCVDYSKSQNKTTTLGNASTRDAADIRRDVTLNAKTMSQMIDQYFVQIKDREYRDAIGRAIAEIYSIDEDQRKTPDFTGRLRNAKRTDIAKQFVKGCNYGLERAS